MASAALDEDSDQIPLQTILSLLDLRHGQRTQRARSEKSQQLTSPRNQSMTRQYLDAMKAVKDFYAPPPPYEDPTSFVVIVALAASVVVFVAYLLSILASDVTPSFEFSVEAFFGWTNEANAFVTLKNLYCGLMLGLVFGFLDNAGLFFGMEKLDAYFYRQASSIVKGLMAHFRGAAAGAGTERAVDQNQNQNQTRPLTGVPGSDGDDTVVAESVHLVASDLMAGLGNTFSDIVGVAFGTAALEMAKAGLNTDPSFWPFDLLAMLIGCLLGCIMPALYKHSGIFDAPSGSPPLLSAKNAFFVSIALLLLAIAFAAVPEEDTTSTGGDWSFWVSLTFLALLVVQLLFYLLKKAPHAKVEVVWQQVSAKNFRTRREVAASATGASQPVTLTFSSFRA